MNIQVRQALNKEQQARSSGVTRLVASVVADVTYSQTDTFPFFQAVLEMSHSIVDLLIEWRSLTVRKTTPNSFWLILRIVQVLRFNIWPL